MKKIAEKDLLDLQDNLEDKMIRLSRHQNKDKEHIKKYHTARKQHQLLINRLDDYHFKNPKISDAILNQGLELYNISFQFKDPLQLQAFFDFLIYPHFEDCLCELFLREKKVRSGANVSMIKAMLDSKIGLYKIKELDPVNCMVRLENVLTNEILTIVDERMALINKKALNVFICFRVITWNDISFQTGLSLAFDKNDSKIRKWIKYHKTHRLQSDILIDLYLYYWELIQSGTNIKTKMKYVR